MPLKFTYYAGRQTTITLLISRVHRVYSYRVYSYRDLFLRLCPLKICKKKRKKSIFFKSFHTLEYHLNVNARVSSFRGWNFFSRLSNAFSSKYLNNTASLAETGRAIEILFAAVERSFRETLQLRWVAPAGTPFSFSFFFFFFSLPSAEEWKIYSYWKIEGVGGREKIQKRCHETGVVRLQSLVPGCRCVGLTIMSGAFRSSSSHNFTHTGRRDRWLESSAAEYPAGRLNFALSARWAIPP